MKKISGAYYFDGDEEDVAFEWMWDCLEDLSPEGRLETIRHIVNGTRPDREDL